MILDPFVCSRREDKPDAFPVQGPLTETLEIELLGVDHAEIMALACRFWRFPEPQVKGIRFHHHPAQSSQSALAYVAHLGHVLSQRAGFGCAANEAPALEDGVLEFLALQPAEVDELQLHMIQELERLEAAFH